MVKYLKPGGILFLVVLWGGLGIVLGGPSSERPNIVVAIADDWGWPHAGAYGDPVVATPTFDRLADEGVLFKHAYVSSPSCTPSRGALLTGQWHWRLEEGANLWSTLDKEIPVYPALLEEAGYFVGFTRKGWGPGRLKPGGRSRNPAGPRFESFEAFLEKRPEDKPFCFWFGSQDPHRGYRKGSGEASGMELSEIDLPACFPDSETVRSDVADYYWEVQRFDRETGALLEQLQEQGELDDTLVVMTGDHGMPFPRCKGNLYDTGTRVPLAIRWPEQIDGNRTVTDFVSLTDLAPTFLELAGREPPGPMTGRSLVTLLKSGKSGDVVSGRNFVLTGKERHVPAQEGDNPGGTPMRAIRTDDYLYIRNYKPNRWPAGTPFYTQAYSKGAWFADIDNGPTKRYMYLHRNDNLRHRQLYDLAFGKRPGEELYDLSKDPGQLYNVADDPGYADIKQRLARRLTEELKASGDPRATDKPVRFDEYRYYGGAPKAPKAIRQRKP